MNQHDLSYYLSFMNTNCCGGSEGWHEIYKNVTKMRSALEKIKNYRYPIIFDDQDYIDVMNNITKIALEALN